MKLVTRDTAGNINGWLLPLWSALEHPELRPDQVYVTAIAPHTRKGPHLHMKRRGVFAVLSGRVVVQTASQLRPGKSTRTIIEKYDNELIIVPPGIACALYNMGDTEALVVNMPSPAWSAEHPDEYEVTDWEDPPGWEQK